MTRVCFCRTVLVVGSGIWVQGAGAFRVKDPGFTAQGVGSRVWAKPKALTAKLQNPQTMVDDTNPA